MQIVIRNYKLINLLKKVSGGVCKVNSKSILSHILLKVLDNKIFCISINETLEIVAYDILDDSFSNIEFIIDYDLIYNISRKTNLNTNIIIRKNRRYIEIFADDSVFKLSKNFDVFPSFQFNDKSILKIKVDSKLFLNLLKHIRVSIADNHPQRFLNGVLFDINNSCLNALSSDGFRLSFFNILNIKINNISFKLIIPKLLINELLNIFVESHYIYIIFFSNQIKFVTDKITITSKLVNDIYNVPDLFLDLFNSVSLKLKTIDVKNAFDKITSIKLSDEKAILSISSDKIIVKAGDFIQNVTVFFTINATCEKIEVGLNYIYLKDILKLLNCEFFEFILLSDKNIIILKEFNSNFLHIMMSYKI